MAKKRQNCHNTSVWAISKQLELVLCWKKNVADNKTTLAQKGSSQHVFRSTSTRQNMIQRTKTSYSQRRCFFIQTTKFNIYQDWAIDMNNFALLLSWLYKKGSPLVPRESHEWVDVLITSSAVIVTIICFIDRYSQEGDLYYLLVRAANLLQ